MPLITKVLDPQQLNAETLARLAVDDWADLVASNPRLAQRVIDKQQHILDGLVREGVLKVG